MITHFYLNFPCLFCCNEILIYNFNIYLSVSNIETGTKSEISGVMWQVAPEYKIQLVSCKVSPKYLLEISALEEIGSIDAYIFCELFCSVLLSDVLSIFSICTDEFMIYLFQLNFFYKISVSENLLWNNPLIHI